MRPASSAGTGPMRRPRSAVWDSPADGRVPVVHVGDSPSSSAGGISRVIRGHAVRPLKSFAPSTLPSFAPTAPRALMRQLPALRSLHRLVRAGRRRARPAILHVHMSKGFSHVREGAFCLVGRLLDWRVVVTWHSSRGLSASRFLSRALFRLSLLPAHVVTVLS